MNQKIKKIGNGVLTSVFLMSLIQSSGYAQSSSPSHLEDSQNGLSLGTVHTSQSGMGDVLTDWNGKSVYIFDLDRNGQSNCLDACAVVWTPLLMPDSHILNATGNADTSAIGSITRSDGTIQITYDGMPLYLYSKDMAQGDMSGQGVTSFGGNWSLVHPDGSRVEAEMHSLSGNLNPRSNSVDQNYTGSAGTYNSGYGNNYGGGYDSGYGGYGSGYGGYGTGYSGYGSGYGGYGTGYGGYGTGYGDYYGSGYGTGYGGYGTGYYGSGYGTGYYGTGYGY